MSKQCLRILPRLNPTRLNRIVTNTSTRCIVTHQCVTAATLDTRGVFTGARVPFAQSANLLKNTPSIELPMRKYENELTRVRLPSGSTCCR